MKLTSTKFIFALLISIFILFGQTAWAQIIYVNANVLSGNLDGTSWDDAFTDLQDALATFQTGDQIWVAEGEYLPDGSTGLRTKTFNLPDDLRLYGGFANAIAISANDGDFSQRDTNPTDSPTILSGAIGATIDTDNSFHVLTANNVLNITLDGFIIEKGNSTGATGATGATTGQGAGMLIQVSILEVFKCIFRDNFALDAGGAISMKPDSDLNLTDCHFENNSATIGGAINNDQNLRIFSSTFVNNTSNNQGGAIYNTSSLEINASKFENNRSTAASSRGGAIYHATGNFTSNGNDFNANSANSEGGAVYSGSGASLLTIDNTIFTDNTLISATGTGAALRVEGDLTLTSSTFINNNTRNGGAIYVRGSSGDQADIDRCIFRENGTVYGAIYVDGNILANISNSLFDGNRGGIGNGGSAISAWGASTTNITNCTFVNQIGSAPSVVNAQEVSINIQNSIFWDNAKPSISQTVTGGNPASILIKYSLVSEINASTWLGAIFTSNLTMIYAIDPSFRNPNLGDYRLKPNSPSIDAGDGSIVSLLTDLDGNPRIIDFSGGTAPNAIDLGAYESPDNTNFPLANAIIYVNANSPNSPNDGKSWDTPFLSLQEVLGVAYAGHQIWVAEGLYYPADLNNPDRDFSFNLVQGVRLYGGFDQNIIGSDDGNFALRNVSNFSTILSGDIGAVTVDADNSYHVLVGDNLNNTSILDGFVIQDGKADGGSSNNQGGGILLTNSNDFTIQNCEFKDNFANNGATVYADASDANFINILAHDNLAQANGGAFFLNNSNASIINCTIVENDVTNAGNNGAGIYSQNSNLEIYNTIIFDNASGGSENLLFQFNDTDNNFTISNSIVENWGGGTGSYTNSAILNTGPNLDGNFKIQNVSSPAVNAGDNSFLPPAISFDLANTSRIQNSRIDIGAFESPFAINLYEVKNTSSNPNLASSLPWVIDNVNTISNGTATVTFDIPTADAGYDGVSKWTISLNSPLVINQNAIFDATTQTGWTDIPVIQIDGTSTVTRLFDFQVGGISNPNTSEVYGFEFSNADADALVLENVDNCIIGSLGKMNVFNDDGNANVGLVLNGADNNQVIGNRFGTDVTGASPLGNLIGIFFEGTSADNNLISQNTIAYNQKGITFRSGGSGGGTGNRITQNSIHSNGNRGIDLNHDNNAFEVNDAADTDNGANLNQNYPVLSNATANGNQLTFTYDLSSFTPSGNYDLEFFLSDGNKQGKVFLLTYNETTLSAITTTITTSFPIQQNQKLVATATDASGNTSEFSNDTPITIEPPILGIAKQVGIPVRTGFGIFDVIYTINLENFGNTAIENLRVTDDLQATFGIGSATFTINTPFVVSSSLTANPAFNGNGDINLLTSGTLAIGAVETITFTVSVDLNGDTSLSLFNNFAIATGSSANGIGTSDTSTNKTDPDPNGDATPNEQILTPVTLENPVLGLAKEVISQNYIGSNQFDVTYRIYLENLGNVALQNVQVEDNLFNTFTGTTILGIQSLAVSTASLTVNPAFNGNGDINLLTSGTLAIGAVETITFTVSVDLNGNTSLSLFNNFAIATGSSPNGTATNDISTNGNNPDLNNDGNPNENEFTPVTLINNLNPPLNLQASSLAAGRVELTWLENTNNELGFRIERSDNGGNTYLLLDSVGIDETFFLDSLATPTLKYTYRVQAYNASLSSAYSNQAEIVVNVFEEIASTLPDISNGKVAWGDYDNDNDLDILIIGESSTNIFTNTGNDNFSNSGITNLPILKNGDAIWKDFDKDGDLDILISGLSQTNVPQTFIYRNLGSSFEQITNSFVGLHLSALASADFDNDGDNDIVITGATDFAATNPISRIYFNLGNAEFDTTFVELEGLKNSAVATVDIDNNGFIDIVIAGETSTGGLLTQIYDNQDSLFVPKTSNLPNLKNASLAFADFDNDNDFDILIAGQQLNGDALSQVFENQNGTSWNLKSTLTGAYGGSSKWSDFNNDGFADILISGTRSNGNPLTRIYANNAGASFENSEMTLPRLTQSSAAWADYDQDGDQDLLFTGFNGTRNRTFLLRSIQSKFKTNEVPVAPTTLSTNTKIIDGNVFTTFEWNLGTDTQSTLSYNIFIQNAKGEFLVSPQANVGTGFNRLPQIGNSQRNFSMTFKNLAGGNYDWGVQSIDAALRVSPFATSNASISCPASQNLVLQEAILEDCPNDGTTVNVIMEGDFEVNQVNTDVFLRWGTVTNSYSNLKVLGTDIKLEPNESSRIDIFTDTVEMFPATTYYYILETKNACGDVQQSAERVLTTPVILGENQIGNSQDIERTEIFADLFDVGTLPSHTDPVNLQITWEQSRNAADWTATTNNNGGLNLTGFAADSTLYFRRVLTSQMCSDTSNAVLIKVFQPFVHELDSMLLVEIYNATGGENWTNSWDLTTRVRDWHGITAEDGRVVEVDLSNNNLEGELPDVFDIANQDNSITSAIRYLSFFNNRIGGNIPPTLGELFPSVAYLDLSLNIFEGKIPIELGKLIKLETLWLSHNKLEGEVPAPIGNLANLRTFTLNNNKLTALAGELGNLDKLIFFDFSDNLIAALHDETLTMERLQELIANNLLLKEIPTAFGNCPLLRIVEFEGNRLTSIPQSVQNIALLERLKIGNNLLDFGDIEPLLEKSAELFNYSPQAELDLAYDSVVEVGKKIILQVNSEGVNNLYQWSLNGNDIDGATSAEYTIFYADQDDAGVYTCRVINSKATDITLRRRPIRITISCGNLIDAIAQTQDPLVFCEGDNIFVQLKATQGEGFTYQWSKNNHAIFLATDSNFVATSAGNYSVKITSPQGCGEVSNQLEILQNATPQVSISTNGATLSFTTNVPVSILQWLWNGEPIPNANDLSYEAKKGGKYSILITDNAGCTVYSKEIVLGVTGLEDEEEQLDNEQLTVYPNPTNVLLNIRVPSQLGKVHTLALQDNLGRVLLTLEVKNQNEVYTLDLQNIASGVYWLRVLTEKEYFTHKIEKQ